jgi:hypothetical protein
MEMFGKIHPTLNPFDRRKECCMDPQKVTTMANKFQAVLDEEVLNERGHALGLLKRKRLVTPFRMGLSVIASMATQHVQTIADLHRHFNELWGLDTDYNAFYKQLDKSPTPEFFLDTLSHLMSHLTMNVLGFESGIAYSEFGRLILQDGSSFALHQALADVFPGRFNAVSPAAVELHCTMDVLQDAPIVISLSPDTDSEHHYRPAPESLRGDLLLADRGYLDLTYLRDIDRHGGFFSHAKQSRIESSGHRCLSRRWATDQIVPRSRLAGAALEMAQTTAHRTRSRMAHRGRAVSCSPDGELESKR